MQDRVSLYPGRVKLTPVSGQENTYDMVRADEPTQEGTPLSKATFLKDSTAALFGLDATAVPDDALALLSRFQSGLGNEYVWGKTKSNEEIIQIGNTKSYFVGPSEEVQYSSDVYIDNGTIKLRNPVTSTFGSLGNGIVSKYFYANFDTSKIRFCTSLNVGSSSSECFYKDLDVNTITTFYGYVNSSDPNAYPPAVSDGYTYTPFGPLGGFSKIATGNYIGTGTYGSSNPNSLTFDFEPKIWGIYSAKDDAGKTRIFNNGPNIIPWDLSSGTVNMSILNSSASVTMSKAGNSVSWYGSSATNQLNNSGFEFYWVAIG